MKMNSSMKIFSVLALIIFAGVPVFAQKSPIVVYLAGDSTMAEKKPEKRPETGWGEMLQAYFDEGKVKIENHAQNGRSTRTFISENRWQTIVDKLKKGDYVFVQFGHNDQSKEKVDRYTPPEDYRKNLIRFIEEVRAKNANPVLLTPVMRRKFDAEGKFVDQHGVYPGIVREVAKEYKTPLVDMHRTSEKVLVGYGVEESKKLFLQLQAGENPNYPNGVNDNTHFNPRGAEEMVKLAVEGIREQKIGLRKYLKK
ncbi:MAG: rhamnogalacturonan acetylesterase [uncultured Pyrinomonadaceae bacterium]|uniref:Rhamnogalacturonan acetylesterase n=1 Tax=uncultured Pyrinomonadaceae bacterium TaxID=2283094 RepID=A0A6J4NKA7_9BACT|nr:MAG: rhamnogalacturonan acetylesterase [uncultured Pyrinomonadaceae bacterium]